ncbi:MAG: glycosyltransferase family 2 protein [Saprospiraceae bacterium]|nr:glycosyltransferase family 2 protein [Saprospiraceae bacterium]
MNISVVIPVFNAATFIERAVTSVVAHPEVKQIILVEDGSTDNSLEICQRLTAQHPCVELHRHPGGVNCGAGASRNTGMAHVNQEYTCFLDADDTFTSIRFVKEREVFAQHLDADGVYGATGTVYHDSTGAAAWEKSGLDENTLTTVRKPVPPKALFEYLVGYRPAKHSPGHIHLDALTLKTRALHKLNLRFAEHLILHQDTAFIWQCAYYLRMYPGELDRPIAKYILHQGSRFIHYTDLSSSRTVFFSFLLNWIRQDGLEKKYFLHFKRLYCRARKANCSVLERLELSLSLLKQDPGALHLILNDCVVANMFYLVRIKAKFCKMVGFRSRNVSHEKSK